MGILKDILGEIVKIDFKPEADQMGISNIKTTKNTYNTNLIFTTPDAARDWSWRPGSGSAPQGQHSSKWRLDGFFHGIWSHPP